MSKFKYTQKEWMMLKVLIGNYKLLCQIYNSISWLEYPEKDELESKLNCTFSSIWDQQDDLKDVIEKATGMTIEEVLKDE
jgi:hypothetical protein